MALEPWLNIQKGKTAPNRSTSRT